MNTIKKIKGNSICTPMNSRYEYIFETTYPLELENLCDLNIKDTQYENVLMDFKVELYSKIYKLSKDEVIIQSHQKKIKL